MFLIYIDQLVQTRLFEPSRRRRRRRSRSRSRRRRRRRDFQQRASRLFLPILTSTSAHLILSAKSEPRSYALPVFFSLSSQ